MDQDARPPFGRIRLSAVVAEWSANHVMNPRALAAEVAAALRRLPTDQVLHESTASAVLFDPVAGRGGITFGALASYFEAIRLGGEPETIQTSTGAVRSAAVLISSSWIGRVTLEAEERAALVAGYAVPAAMFGGEAASAPAIMPPSSGSEPVYLKIREAQQRQEGERSAAEQLDSERIKRERAELEVAELRTKLTTREAQLEQAREDEEKARRALNDERRARQQAEEQLREHAGIIAFMDPNNPLSPEQGRLSVDTWCQLTDNGTADPVDETRVGLRKLCERLLNNGTRTFSGSILDRITWFINWPARKNGGALATPDRSKV
ncbi:hypothetical protein FQZ97_678590 [compost metagenome]